MDEKFSISLADMIHYKLSTNKSFRDLFILIDHFSR